MKVLGSDGYLAFFNSGQNFYLFFILDADADIHTFRKAIRFDNDKIAAFE